MPEPSTSDKTTTADAPPRTSNKTRRVLQLQKYRKQYRGHSGTTDKDFVAEYFFALQSLDTPPRTHGAATPGVVGFWCEVQLKTNLASRGGWKNLSKKDKFKALYCYAVDHIRETGGRVVRQISMNWTPGTRCAEGPCWDLSKIDLRRPDPVTFEGDEIRPWVSEKR